MDSPSLKENQSNSVSSSSSSTLSNVWPVLKIVLIIIVVVLVLTVGYKMLSPFFRMMSSLFGIFDTILSSLNKQLETCQKEGWFSTDCGIGIAGIVTGGVWLLVTLATLVVQYKSANKSIETAKAETGKTGAELCKEMIDKTGIEDIESLKEKMKETGKFTDEQINDVNVQKAFLEGVATNFSVNKSIEAVKNQPMNKDELEQKIAEYEERADQDIKESANENELNEEERENVEEAANEIEPREIVGK